MTTAFFFQNLGYRRVSSWVIAVGLICIFFASSVHAQNRNPDLILTVKNDTLLVRIIEVGISDLKYRQLAGDTITTYTVVKADVARVFYGNGDEEEFKHSAPTLRAIRTDRRYHKIKIKPPFQKEIAHWSIERLMAERELYGQKYRVQKIGGAVAISTGGAAAAVGVVLIVAEVFSALFSLTSNHRYDDTAGIKPLVFGAVLATGAGIPLSVSGRRNKKKYKAIKKELEIRGVLAD